MFPAGGGNDERSCAHEAQQLSNELPAIFTVLQFPGCGHLSTHQTRVTHKISNPSGFP